MFFAIFKNNSDSGFQDVSLNSLHNQLDAGGYLTEEFNFYKGTKIEVREIPSRLELVPEVKKSAPVRKPAAKSKK